MEYFFTPKGRIQESFLFIENDEAHHLAKVLRKEVGEKIFVTDGEDNSYEVVIRSIHQNLVECEIISHYMRKNESWLNLTLAFSVLKNPARNDFIIEKCVEIGARNFIPIFTQRTIASNAKIERWNQISLSAMKQSCRSFLPKINNSLKFTDLILLSNSFDLKIIPHEQTDTQLFIGEVLRFQKNSKNILVVIGPEGGFTDEEILQAEKNNFIQTSLGKRRLRSETAAITSTTLILGAN